MPDTPYTQWLSKSRYVAGYRCHRLLWWKVHERDAPELQHDPATQDRLDQGRQVGELARTRFPGGVLIDLPYYEFDARVAATAEALAAGAPVIFEASFMADRAYAAVDVLERTDGGFNLIEVKASNSQKDEHLPDAAIQTYVLRRSGIDVARVEIMHLNGEYRHPVGELFQRTDVTAQVDELLPGIADEIERQLEVISGPRPDMPIGPCCFEPDECPFVGRCWPSEPDHIRTLYGVKCKTAWKYMQQGIHSIWDIPPDRKISAAARRQLRALEEGALIVEPGLAEALAPFSGRLGFLDFETVGRAIPVWPGLAPWGAVPVQFSYHEESADGATSHAGWLAEGPDDPRPALAQALLQACGAADRIVAYTSFERRCIEHLQQNVPELAAPLDAIKERLIDLPTVIRDHVYHPEFGGGFGLKNVLTPLVPDLSYDALPIKEGGVASIELARLLLEEDTIPIDERARLRHDLLEYCKQDTWAMVMLVRRLRELAA